MYQCYLNLKTADVLFGVPNTENIEMFNVLNFCVLLAKQFIRKCHKEDLECNLNQYKCGLKSRLEVEQLILNDQQITFIAKWAIINSNLAGVV